MLRKVSRLRHWFNISVRRKRATLLKHYYRQNHVIIILIGLALFLATSFVIGIYLNSEKSEHKRRRRSEVVRVARTKTNVEQSRIQRGEDQIPFFNVNTEDDINGWNTLRIRDGYSLIAACRNERKTFNAALRSWKKIQEIDEIVLVNWGGSMEDEIHTDSRIKTIHVQGGDQAWSPARALNLAAKLTTRRNVIKADCDATIHWRFLKSHRLTGGIFFASNERDGKSTQSQHSTGVLVVRRKDLVEVNGFDDRFDSPGWEDSDLCGRLADSGLARMEVDHKYVSHIDHDLVRTGEPALPESQSQRNKVMASMLPRWVPKDRGCTFAFETRDITIAYLKECPPSLKESIPEETFRNTNREINTELLEGKYGFTPNHLDRASHEVLSTLVDLIERKELSLVVRPTGTLPTRLAALGSALELTRLTERYLVIVWIPEVVCPSTWGDLFLTQQGRTIGIVESELPPFPESIAATYTYGPRKRPVLPLSRNDTIYVKTEGPIYADVPWTNLAGSIRSLKPSILVRQTIIDAKVKKSAIGVHVRTRNSLNFEVVSTEIYVQAIRTEIETSNGPDPSFVLATDSSIVRRDILKELGDRVVTVGQACHEPTVECDQNAWAEIWLLMKTNRILTGTPDGDYEMVMKASSIPLTIVAVPSVTDDSIDMPSVTGDSIDMSSVTGDSIDMSSVTYDSIDIPSITDHYSNDMQ